ncbi:hypothetical protein AB0M95_18955 [Sphaerisporangium sp. NPDC051017]
MTTSDVSLATAPAAPPAPFTALGRTVVLVDELEVVVQMKGAAL